MSSGDTELQPTESPLGRLIARVIICAALSFSATHAIAGTPGERSLSRPLPDSLNVAAPIPGPILDPNAMARAHIGPVMPARLIEVRAIAPVPLPRAQLLQLAATKLRPPQTGPLADLFRSVRPVPAPDPPRDTTLHLPKLPTHADEVLAAAR